VPLIRFPLLGNDGTGPFHIRNIDGLGPVKATINSRAYGVLDGEYYTGGHIGKRNIVITLGLNPSSGYRSVGTFRKLLYAYLQPKNTPLLRFIFDDRPPVQIVGYVESLEPTLFLKDPEVQVSIICPKPFFESPTVKTVVGVAKRGALDTPFEYKGDVTNGIAFKLDAGGQAYTGPIIIESGQHQPTYRKFETAATINPERYFAVNSPQGFKTVESRSVATKLRVANLLGTMTNESLWPYVVPGFNKVRVRTNSDAGMPWVLYYIERFGGL
jgi:hypothetical protein